MGIKKAFLRSDKAACHHNRKIVPTLQGLRHWKGTELMRYDYSKTQAGEDMHERFLCCLKTSNRRYCTEGHVVVWFWNIYIYIYYVDSWWLWTLQILLENKKAYWKVWSSLLNISLVTFEILNTIRRQNVNKCEWMWMRWPIFICTVISGCLPAWPIIAYSEKKR